MNNKGEVIHIAVYDSTFYYEQGSETSTDAITAEKVTGIQAVADLTTGNNGTGKVDDRTTKVFSGGVYPKTWENTMVDAMD